MIAQGNVGLIRTEENKHLAQFDIIVHAAYRCQGIGKQLPGLIMEISQVLEYLNQ